MKFKTIGEAEQFYFKNISQTNNSHNEEEAKLDSWLGEQKIEELKN